MSPTTRSFPTATTARTQIIARVVPLIGELIAAHAPDLVVIACNTASTLVMSHLRERLHRALCRHRAGDQAGLRQFSKTKRVSVLGTRGTVKREYTRALIRDFAQGCEVTLVGSADLASLAEAALSGEAVSDADIAAEIAPCFVGNGASVRRTDTVVLACTHYPLLLDRLVAAGALAGGLDRSRARDRAAGFGSARPPRQRGRRGRRRNDLHLQAAAHAEPGPDAVFRRPRPGVNC